MLAGVVRFMFRDYMPAAPEDLRLTETEVSPSGLTRVVSQVEIPSDRRVVLERFQQRQHDMRNELQHYVGEREIQQVRP